MNCKEGDLAIVICGEKSSGRIVRCIKLVPGGTVTMTKCGRRVRVNEDDGPQWLVDGWAVFWAPEYGQFEASVIPDYGLRPIRDPGEDAQDETLSWLPVPSKTLESA